MAGDASRRTLIYIARRKLGMSAREWLSTPWWEQRLLIEGLNSEGIITLDGVAGDGQPPGDDETVTDGLQSENVTRQGGVTVTDRQYSYDLSDAESLPSGDFTVGTIG